MTGVFEGFATIGLVIALGVLLAHFGVLGLEAKEILARLAFFVATPALMVTMLSRTDLSQVLSANLAASFAAVVVAGGGYALLARFVWRRTLGDGVIGTLAAAYVNAGNLGIPIATYVLGGPEFVAPTLLMQLLFLQPLALLVLDHAAHGRTSWRQTVLRPLTNPLTVGSVAGVVLSLTGTTIPRAVAAPLELVGAMAVPGMLIAYGVALRLGPGLGSGGSVSEVATTTAIKLVLQPLTAWFVAHELMGLDGHELLAVVVTSALPTAQNVFTHAVRYGKGEVLARDTILLTTIGSVPVILLLTWLLT